MRSILTLLHRWAGLFIALFLFVAGATGAAIAWDHELDEWLNPHLFEARDGLSSEPLAPLTLARQLAASAPNLRVGYLPLAVEPGHTLLVSVKARIDASTGTIFDLGFNQMALDPATGAVQGTREWGAISLSRENLLPFLYKLHYCLHTPDVLLLLMLAITSVSMNLGREVMKPVVSLFSPVASTPFETRTPTSIHAPIKPTLAREQVVALAQAEAARRGWSAPPGAIFYAERFGLYGVGFFAPQDEHADGGLGNPWLYFDGRTGALAGSNVPGTGSAGDIFMQAQFPLHSGRILGLPGRILISFMGVMVALLSVTGVVIWTRKRRARAKAAARLALGAQALLGEPMPRQAPWEALH